MTRALQWIALAAAYNVGVAAHAAQSDTRVPSPAAKVSRQLVEQKEAFLKRVLSDSPATRRIEASKNSEAGRYLKDAQENHGKAVLSIKNDEIATADRQLNDAISFIGKARQLAPDPLTSNVEHRVRYAQMLESVESLRISYQRHLQRANRQPPGMVANDAQLRKVAQLVDSAKSLANTEQIMEANKALGDAERTLMVSLSRVLVARTIEYAQRFKTVAEEYSYELDRNLSYAGLIPIAIAEFKPGSDTLREVQNFVNTNRRLREQAQQQAAKTEYRAALATLHGGTARLQSALAAAGLRVPQDAKPD